MSILRGFAFFLAVSPVFAQSIIATHSGVVHYFEGAVFMDGRPLESHLGRFSSLPQGSELKTADGRAEVLLTPGVFLRMGNETTIRMVSNDLSDTRVELETGSAIVDAGESNADTSVSVLYKSWKVHVVTKGVYRIDTDPPHIAVTHGKADVYASGKNEPVAVEAGMSMPFAEVLVPDKATELSTDALNDWENGRSESIAADNTIAAQIDAEPASQAGDLDGFTYFPLIDVPYMGAGGSTYPYGYGSGLVTYQPGFNSIYLPGYTYAPMLLGLAGRGSGIYVPSPPLRIGSPLRSPYGLPVRSPLRSPLGSPLGPPLGSTGTHRYGYQPMPLPPAGIHRSPTPMPIGGAPVHAAPRAVGHR